MHLAPGDHLVSPRWGFMYMHHGIYVAEDLVVHYSGLNSGVSAGPIVEESLEAFASGNEVRTMPAGPGALARNDVIARAFMRVGEDEYSVISNNCEHFANWCVYGQAGSAQVKGALNRTTGSPALAAALRTVCGGHLAGIGASLLITACTQVAATRVKWGSCKPVLLAA